MGNTKQIHKIQPQTHCVTTTHSPPPRSHPDIETQPQTHGQNQLVNLSPPTAKFDLQTHNYTDRAATTTTRSSTTPISPRKSYKPTTMPETHEHAAANHHIAQILRN